MRTLLALTALVLFSGTAHATPYLVTVNAMAAPGAQEKKTYLLVPDENLDVRSLEHQQYERQIKECLAKAGFVEAADPAQAQIAIWLTYGIGPPDERVVNYSLPVWGQTGVSSSQTTGTVNTIGNTSTINTTTTHTPQYGITGYRNVTGTQTTFDRHLTLVAADYQKFLATGEVVPVWDAKMVSTGWSGVLSQIIPVMLSKSYEYFGTNTGQPRSFRVTDRSRAVRNLRD